MKTKIAALIATLGLSFSAHAGFMLEPYLGYETGKFEMIDTTPTTVNIDTTGTEVGLRVGYVNRFFVALDAQMTSGGKMKYTKPTGIADMDYSRTIMSIDFGYYFTSMFRGYLGYGASSSFTHKYPTADVKYKGTSAKVGLGYHLHKNVAFTFEYQMPSYKKYEVSGVEADISAAYPTFNNTNVMLIGFSFPFIW